MIWKVGFELGLEGFRKVEFGTNDFLKDKWHKDLKTGEYWKLHKGQQSKVVGAQYRGASMTYLCRHIDAESTGNFYH